VILSCLYVEAELFYILDLRDWSRLFWKFLNIHLCFFFFFSITGSLLGVIFEGKEELGELQKPVLFLPCIWV